MFPSPHLVSRWRSRGDAQLTTTTWEPGRMTDTQGPALNLKLVDLLRSSHYLYPLLRKFSIYGEVVEVCEPWFP